jgi:hypothetical protein
MGYLNNLNRFWGFYHGTNLGTGSSKVDSETPIQSRDETFTMLFTSKPTKIEVLIVATSVGAGSPKA